MKSFLITMLVLQLLGAAAYLAALAFLHHPRVVENLAWMDVLRVIIASGFTVWICVLLWGGK